MVVSANPRCRSNHGDNCDNDTNDAPGERDLRSVLLNMVLEGADHCEDEPGNTGGCTAGVDATDVLNETSPEDAHPQRCPLGGKTSQRGRV